MNMTNYLLAIILILMFAISVFLVIQTKDSLSKIPKKALNVDITHLPDNKMDNDMVKWTRPDRMSLACLAFDIFALAITLIAGPVLSLIPRDSPAIGSIIITELISAIFIILSLMADKNIETIMIGSKRKNGLEEIVKRAIENVLTVADIPFEKQEIAYEQLNLFKDIKIKNPMSHQYAGVFLLKQSNLFIRISAQYTCFLVVEIGPVNKDNRQAIDEIQNKLISAFRIMPRRA